MFEYGVGQCRAAIKLRIEQIEAYERSLSTLAPGMTGRFNLSGRGFEAIEMNTREGEYIHLEAPVMTAIQAVSLRDLLINSTFGCVVLGMNTEQVRLLLGQVTAEYQYSPERLDWFYGNVRFSFTS